MKDFAFASLEDSKIWNLDMFFFGDAGVFGCIKPSLTRYCRSI
jgi:hypothetical protein